MSGGRTANLHAFRAADPEGFARLVWKLRDAAARYAETTSLRQAAREIGMSPTGLHGFLTGNEPYLVTVRKLVAWDERAGEHPQGAAIHKDLR